MGEQSQEGDAKSRSGIGRRGRGMGGKEKGHFERLESGVSGPHWVHRHGIGVWFHERASKC